MRRVKRDRMPWTEWAQSRTSSAVSPERRHAPHRLPGLIADEGARLALSNEIGLQAKTTFVERERKAGLRGQMAMIQRDLGEGGGKAHEVAELAQAITTVNMRRRRNASC